MQDHRANVSRHKGHLAGPLVAHARRRWRTGRGHVGGDHACPRVHADARVVRHVVERVGIWRAHRLVDPGKKFGAVTQMRYLAPSFNLNFLHFSFRVGLCPTRFLPFAGDVDARQALDAVKMAEIAWTRVHAIIK